MMKKESKQKELYEKLKTCEKNMDDLAWGIQTNEDFKKFSEWSNKAKEYRKALAKLNARR